MVEVQHVGVGARKKAQRVYEESVEAMIVVKSCRGRCACVRTMYGMTSEMCNKCAGL